MDAALFLENAHAFPRLSGGGCWAGTAGDGDGMRMGLSCSREGGEHWKLLLLGIPLGHREEGQGCGRMAVQTHV